MCPIVLRESDLLPQVTYEIMSGNDAGIFTINGKTGEIFVKHPLSKSTPMYHINVSARDGAGLRFVSHSSKVNWSLQSLLEAHL